MNKMIKVSLFACLLFMGLAKTVRADNFTTFTTTAVTLSTATDRILELLEVRVGTGSVTYGENYVVIVDTRPLVLYSTGGTTGILLHGANFESGKFPPSQWVIPPIIVMATTTSNSNLAPSGQTVVNLQDVNGEGATIKNGLTVFTVGRDDLPVTIRYRQRKR